MRNLMADETAVVEELKELLRAEADSAAGSVCYPIELRVSGDDAASPGLTRLARQWETFFDNADAHFASRGFPEEDVALLEKALASIANRIRSDKDFWQTLERRLGMPERHQETRLGLEFFYDPVETLLGSVEIISVVERPCRSSGWGIWRPPCPFPESHPSHLLPSPARR